MAASGRRETRRGSLLELDYRTIKLLHIVGAVLFVGNILVTAVWKGLADRTRDPRVLFFAQRLVTWTDFLFTGTGAVLVLGSGLVMSTEFGGFWAVGWLVWGFGLFVTSGVIWIAILVPVQIQQARLARRFVDGGEIPEEYWRLGKMWMSAGAVATILPLINLYLMVLRPG